MPSAFKLDRVCKGAWECSSCAQDFVTSFSPVEHLPSVKDGLVPSHNGYSIPASAIIEEKDILNQPWKMTDDNLVCHNCIRRPFENAIKYDYHWPPRWGSIILKAHHYMPILSSKLRAAYARKVRERKNMIAEHLLLEGQTRGRDYQLCPECGTAIELRDGCNHMVCTCLTNFCFVCGKTARDDDGSGHWKPGGCPRWTNKETGEGQFDDPDLVLNGDQLAGGILIDNGLGLGAPVIHTLPGAPQDWELERRRARDTVRFEIANWTFNVAMFTGNERTRTALESSANVVGPVGRNDRARVAMLLFQDIHGVSYDWWSTISYLYDQHGLNQDFSYQGIGAVTARSHTLHVDSWTQTSHDIYNMVMPRHRQKALRWIESRIRHWTPENDHSSDNFAIFDMGPGGSRKMRQEAAYLMIFLRAPAEEDWNLINLENHHMEVHTMAGNALKIRLRGNSRVAFHPRLLNSNFIPMEELRDIMVDPERLSRIEWPEYVQRLDGIHENLDDLGDQPWQFSERTGMRWSAEHIRG